jgi:cysteinyl-tRNA synthetase
VDVLHRTLENSGFDVDFVMNITDVGHLTSDADEGEDKMEKGAARDHVSVWDVAKKYTELFKEDMQELHIWEPDQWLRATDNIPEQIALIERLEAEGYTYKTSDGVYFDTSKFSKYGALAKLNLKGQKAGARVAENQEKRNPTDFALWKFSPRDSQRQMEWESPWGIGFPGWHLECSAMSMKALGSSFDLHAGGVDHIPVHHTNEIAQSEAATGKPFVRTWVHGEFLLIDDGKMSKSLDNTYTLENLEEKKLSPLAFRLYCLGAHYRSKLNFTWEALAKTQKVLEDLHQRIAALDGAPNIGIRKYEEKFFAAMQNDLNTPQALAVLWELLKSNEPAAAKRASVVKMDEILGLGLATIEPLVLVIPAAIQKLVAEREAARKAKDWAKSDELRKQIEQAGFSLKDTADGQVLGKG